MKQIPENIYAENFVAKNNCLYDVRTNRQGSNERKLCNFVPWLVREVTMDDGVETTTRIALAGVHESGRTLPVVEIRTEDLSSFNWLNKHWGIDCIIEPGTLVKDVIRYAIQTTAHNAERSMVYTVTGWRELEDGWKFLMPGDEAVTVSLSGKMQGYNMERHWEKVDIATSLALLDSKVAPPEILFPMLAFAFLSPLNHFLKLTGHEPKFVLFLVGKTGSRKSTLAALFLSFFGRFTGTELPLSFRDTSNSILNHAFSLKDVLTCIDDFHPAGRQEENKLTASAQSVMRAYGDRTGRGRLRADSSPMETRPPRGNAIITGEFPPDIGESGTARYFSLELHDGDVDLDDTRIFFAERTSEPEAPEAPAAQEEDEEDFAPRRRLTAPKARQYESSSDNVVDFKATSAPTAGGSKAHVVFKKVDSFADVGPVADVLNEKRIAILNLETCPTEEAVRVIDFLSGVAYANGGQLKRVANNTFIITPYNVGISGDLIDELENTGMFF